MSSGTTSRSNEVDDEDEYETGFADGERWVTEHASKVERNYLLGVIRGGQQPPDFESCRDGLEAAHEFVRRINPPCGLHRDSAMAYWGYIYSSIDYSKSYIVGFFTGARDNVRFIISGEAERDAVAWIELYLFPEQLEHVERFVDQHGDTWQDQRPEGCVTVVNVVLYMIGDTIRWNFPELFRPVPFLQWSFPGYIEEYATDFIDEVVRYLRRRQAQTHDPSPNEPGVRQPRKIRLKDSSPTAEGHEGTSTPPAEDEQT